MTACKVNNLSTYLELIAELRQGYQSKRTGTLVVIGDHQLAQIVLQQGRIIALSCLSKLGMDVIPLIRQNKTCTYHFINRVNTPPQPLPATEIILNAMSKGILGPSSHTTDAEAANAPVAMPTTTSTTLHSPPLSTASVTPSALETATPTTLPLLPFTQLMQHVHEYCHAHFTGTISILNAEQKHLAALVLRNGLVIGVAYGTLYGQAAIPLIRQIKLGALRCLKDNVALLKLMESALQKNPLPANNEALFKLFGYEYQVEEEPIADAKSQRILVVEDSATTRKIIVRMLIQNGYQVIEAENGLEALTQLTEKKPDLMILDIVMPGIDGYKVLSFVRKHEVFNALPVIMLTSRDGLFDKIRGNMSGCDEYLTKPFEAAQLLEKIHKHLPQLTLSAQ